MHCKTQSPFVFRLWLRYKALKLGDTRLAFDLLKDEAKLLGLYPDRTHKQLTLDLSTLTDHQLEQLVHGEDIIKVLTL